MSGWAVKMQRRAAHLGSAVSACTRPPAPYPCRMEKVKFGVPFHQICKPDIPGPLLVLILKLNKEGPSKRDVFRAPGHQANMKKLIHFLQTGRLVNIANFSVHTISSVVKKFLRKLPDGIFGVEAEKQLFDIILSTRAEALDLKWKQEEVRRIISELPKCTQQLLVLLFGTFRAVSLSSSPSTVVPSTGMSSEALGVSVAPSFFHTCVGAGRQATMDDVIRFKAATKIMKFLIDHFGTCNLFGTENYRYYSRITGRCLKIDDAWIMDFGRPPNALPLPGPVSLEAEMTWLQYAALTWKPAFSIGAGQTSEDHGSTSDSLNVYPEASGSGTNTMLESARLCVSLEGDENFRGANCVAEVGCPDSPEESSGGGGNSASSPSSRSSSSNDNQYVRMTNTVRSSRPLEEHKSSRSNVPAGDSTRSLTLLPQVHERQTARMRTRSEWFLSPYYPPRQQDYAGSSGELVEDEDNS